MFHEKQTAGSSDESDSIVAERNTEHEIFHIYFNNIYSGLKRYLDTFGCEAQWTHNFSKLFKKKNIRFYRNPKYRTMSFG